MTVLSTLQINMDDIFGQVVQVVGENNWKFVTENKWSITAGTIGVYTAYKYLTRPKNLPPGPRGIPVFGAMFNFSSEMHLDVAKFCKQYNSDIISYHMGKQLFVMLNTIFFMDSVSL